MKEKRTITKKTTFNQDELNEIERAMGKDGFRNYNDYFLHLVRKRENSTDAIQRRLQRYQYQYAELFTIYNKLRSGIDIPSNMVKFMEGAGELCRELM